jgi:hypothetical protein
MFWIVVGMYGGPVIYGVLPITLLLMKRRGMYEEMLIGFFLILILSDSYEEHLRFAKSVKNIYVSTLAIFLFFDRKEFRPLNSIYKTFIPFFLISLYCLFYTETAGVSTLKTISYFLIFLIIPNYLTKLYREKGPAVLRNLMLFIATILLISLIMIITNHSVVYISGGRYRGILGNPNGFGLFCFLSFILFSTIRYLYKDLFTRSETIMIFTLLIISLLYTGSRNSIMAVGMFLVFSKFFKINPFLGLVMAIIMGYLVELIGDNFVSIISSLGLSDFFRVKTLNDGSGRYIAWQFAWKQVQNNFFIGKGFGYDEHFMRGNYALLSKMGHQGGIHNTFLTFWMNFGLVGLIIYLRSYFLSFIRAAKKIPYAYPIMFAVTFTAVFESWLVGSLNPHTIIFLMILTIISDDVFYQQNPTEELSLSDENRS